MRATLRTLAALLALASLLVPSALAERLSVVTTVPDLADLAEEVGGERVEVERTLCRGKENLHSVSVRPSHLNALNRCDVLVELGLWAEATWLPSAIQASRNPKIQAGEPGLVVAAAGWEPIEVPESLSRKGGDLHPEGNPHFNTDPRFGRHVTKVLRDAFTQLDPAGEETYAANAEAYLARLAEAEARWERLGADLAGRTAVVYHQEFDYFCRAYDIEVVASLESKPGIPPTARHLASVIGTMREREVPVILTATWSNNRNCSSVADKTGARVVELPHMVGGSKDASTWIELQDLLLARVREAYGLPAQPAASEAGSARPAGGR